MNKYHFRRALVSGLLLAALPVAATIWIFHNTTFVPVGPKELLDLSGFLNSALWIQAFIAWATYCAIAFTASQIFLLFKHNTLLQEAAEREVKRQRDLAEREIFLRLISPEILSAKRFLGSDEIQIELKKLDIALTEKGEVASRELLSALRRRFEEISKKMSWPLLPGTYASLDHVELLLDIYNDLSKQIIDGKLDEVQTKALTTALTIPNFVNTYNNVLPFIKLRQGLSKAKGSEVYAWHFEEYCKKQLETQRA
jgi:hypothetical protein